MALLGMHVGAIAQGDPVTPAIVDPIPPVGITLEQANARISELEESTELGAAAKARLIELYRQIAQHLEAELASDQRTDGFRQSIDFAPAETERVRAEIAASSEAPAQELQEIPEGATADALQQLLTQAQGELAGLRTRQSELEQRIAEEQDRPEQALTQVADARASLSEIRAALTAAPPASDAPEFDHATRWLLEAREQARLAEIQMLEQELLSNSSRLELLAATRDQTIWQVSLDEARVARLEGWVSDLRQAGAERARLDAERLRLEARGKHPLFQRVTAEIAAITREAELVGPRIDAVRRRRLDVEAQLAQTEADYQETQRSLDLGISESLGAVLLEQRHNLPDPRLVERRAAQHSATVAEVRLRLFQIDRELKQLRTPAQVAQQLDEESPEPDLDEGGRAKLENLLVTKRENLERLAKADRDYLAALGNLEARSRDLNARAEELAEILDSRLLWIPNAPRLAPAMVSDLTDGARWLVSPAVWSEAATVAWADFSNTTWAYTLVALLLGMIALAQRRNLAQRERIASRVGKVRDDGILLTWAAFCLHVLSTLPIPAALAFLGWRLGATRQVSAAAEAIGAALIATSITTFLLQLLRSIFRAHGIATAHFHWSRQSGRLVRKHTLGFMGIAIPAVFVLTLAEHQPPDSVIRLGIGRIAFVVLMIAVATLAFFLLHPNKGLFKKSAMATAYVWLRRSRPAWLPFGILLPLFLGGLASCGYYYAALQLEYRFNQTLLIILVAVFLHAILLRWLLISQGRLAYKVALEKHAALAKSREAPDGDPAVEAIVDNFDTIDVGEIKEQTHDLLRAFIGLLLFVGLWFAWVGVLPALRVLDTITLWHHMVAVDGQEQLQPITLNNIVVALIALILTITAARNMPGFLEIALLQRLPLEPGTRYATRTLVLYSIVTVGIVVAFNAVGVGWRSVQWLVAALTVGLGFGLQEIFANLVSGLIILLERPVRVGDTVTVGDVSGVVTRIRMRATTITDWSRRELVVPNKSFITGQLINWSLSDPIMRIKFIVGIAYGSDTMLAHRTLMEVCKEHPMVLDQPEANVFFESFGDNALNFECRVFVTEPTNTGRTRIQHDLHMAIDRAFRDSGIEIAFPQRDLHLKSAEAVLRIERIDREPGGPADASDRSPSSSHR